MRRGAESLHSIVWPAGAAENGCKKTEKNDLQTCV